MRLSPAERAVYELVEHGGFSIQHAALYRRQIGALKKAGLVKKANGKYIPSEPPPPPPRYVEEPVIKPHKVTLVAQVPEEWIYELNKINPANRADAVRTVLALGFEAARQTEPV